MGSKDKAILFMVLTLVALVPLSYYVAKPAHGTLGMTKFASYWELQHFIMKNSCGQSSNTIPGAANYKGSDTQYSYYISAQSAGSVSTAPCHSPALRNKRPSSRGRRT